MTPGAPSAGYVVGIDYGMSHTVAVVRWADGRSQSLVFDGSPLLPSAVYAEPDGRVRVGRDALRQASVDPARFEANPKRRIDEREVLLGDRSAAVVDLVAATLRRVAEEAARVTGAPPAAVTMTYPAAWGATRRTVLVEAAQAAGLPTQTLVPEPVAAAAYFATILGHRVSVGDDLVVYDLGAGTLAVSVVRRVPDRYEVRAVGGMPDFGGLALDAIVVDGVAAVVSPGAPQEWRRLTLPADPAAQRDFMRLWEDARSIKESLSREASAGLHVPSLNRNVIMTREEFETAAAPALERAAALTVQIMRDVQVTTDRLAGVFLVGGASRVPLVATTLHRATGIAPTVLEQPELAVAEGALHASIGPTALSALPAPASYGTAPASAGSDPIPPVPAHPVAPRQVGHSRRLAGLLMAAVLAVTLVLALVLALVSGLGFYYFTGGFAATGEFSAAPKQPCDYMPNATEISIQFSGMMPASVRPVAGAGEDEATCHTTVSWGSEVHIFGRLLLTNIRITFVLQRPESPRGAPSDAAERLWTGSPLIQAVGGNALLPVPDLGPEAQLMCAPEGKAKAVADAACGVAFRISNMIVMVVVSVSPNGVAQGELPPQETRDAAITVAKKVEERF